MKDDTQKVHQWIYNNKTGYWQRAMTAYMTGLQIEMANRSPYSLWLEADRKPISAAPDNWDQALYEELEAESLADLLAGIQSGAVELTADLPVFGGDEPAGGTLGVWSWDADSVLVGECVADLRIYARDEWEN